MARAVQRKTRCLRRAAALASYLLLTTALSTTARAEGPACRPCAGVRTGDPLALLPQLEREPKLTDQARLFIAPVLGLIFVTPAPLLSNVEQLEAELEIAARWARQTQGKALFQVFWAPSGRAEGDLEPTDYAYLLKRAAVALTGADVDAQVLSQPLPADSAMLAALYDQEVAAYLDGVSVVGASPDTLRPIFDLLTELDPGKPVFVDAPPFPESSTAVLPEAARYAVAGAAATLFDLDPTLEPELAPLKLLAREFQGDLSYDPYSTPGGAGEAWSFVRGEDLGLRVIVQHEPESEEMAVTFSDAYLRQPARIDLTTGESYGMYGGRRTDLGLELRWQAPFPVSLLRLERLTAAELEGLAGLEEELTVVSERQLPVEEILRRLQAFEDGQARRLRAYRALNSTHLRFQLGTEGLEVTFEGSLFFQQGEGFDWAWEKLFINGLRWKGKRLPEIPLIQPERAANLPLEISFTRDYRYRLRGSATVDGRDCWVVDFQPLIADGEESLFRGTVWIDRQLYARVRSRAVQLGLRGDVISNEETIYYSPVDAEGSPAAWSLENYWLPLRVVSQQIWSIFNTATVVEKESVLSQTMINPPDLQAQRQQALDSKVTMVRDTENGLRYLVKDKETGGRVVQEEFDPN
jgi:hypothetical protein